MRIRILGVKGKDDFFPNFFSTDPDPTQQPKRIRILGVKGKDEFFFRVFFTFWMILKNVQKILIFKNCFESSKKKLEKKYFFPVLLGFRWLEKTFNFFFLITLNHLRYFCKGSGSLAGKNNGYGGSRSRNTGRFEYTQFKIV